MGSNPTLSVMRMFLMFPLLQVPGPADCTLTGLCGLETVVARIPSGLMFTAVGLVAVGLIGFRVARQRHQRQG